MKKRKHILIGFLLIIVTAIVFPSNAWALSNLPWVDKALYIYQDNGCYYPDCLSSSETVKFRGEFYYNDQVENNSSQYIVYNSGDPVTEATARIELNGSEIGSAEINNGQVAINLGTLSAGRYNMIIALKYNKTPVWYTVSDTILVINSECSNKEIALCSEKTINGPGWSLCNQINDETISLCQKCLSNQGIWTALGCIPTEPTGLIQTLIKIGLMVGGGIATLIILAGGFMLSISQGDPKKTSEAKDMISAAIIGLIFIVFSISILQLIGVQILQIPEFGE